MRNFIVYLVALLGIHCVSGISFDGEECWPCQCDDRDPKVITVECAQSPMEKVRQRFLNTSTTLDIHHLDLAPSKNDEIPADVFGPNRALQLTLRCPNSNNPSLKGLNVNAFRSSANYTQKIEITNYCGDDSCPIREDDEDEYRCDLSQVDFKFLTRFNKLAELVISHSRNFQQSLATLPPLSDLTNLTVVYSVLNEEASYPNLTNGLKNVQFYHNALSAVMVDQLMNWILKSSEKTLETLIFNSRRLDFVDWEKNNISSIPEKISSFTKLRKLEIVKNYIPIITNGSLRFTAPVDMLDISDCEVETIEADAFQGDFGKAEVSLNWNNLKRFESSVFKLMLHQMRSSNGTLNIAGNPFDCTSDPCHLAWIIRDEPGLLNRVRGGKCSNGTMFHQLSSEGFNHCPAPTEKLGSSSKSIEEEYWPCLVFSSKKGWNANCDDVAMTIVQKIFNQNNEIDHFENVKLTILPGDVIPAEVLGDKVVDKLDLICKAKFVVLEPPKNVLEIEQNSFTSKQVKSLTIANCNLSRIDYGFLTGFNNLTHLTIKTSSEIHKYWQSLPSLGNLSSLTFSNCWDVNNLTAFPVLTNGLTSLELLENRNLKGKDLNRILNWILISSSDTLRVLKIHPEILSSEINSIPEQNGYFTQLNSLDVKISYLDAIKAGLFTLWSPEVRHISIKSSWTKEIEPRAFFGNFSNSQFILETEALKAFESSVFQPILEQMVLGNGTLHVSSSNFDCGKEDPCHLNWLIRDNRKLLKALRGGTCSNGTHFYQLDQRGFSQKSCPTAIAKSVTNAFIKPAQKFFDKAMGVILTPLASSLFGG